MYGHILGTLAENDPELPIHPVPYLYGTDKRLKICEAEMQFLSEVTRCYITQITLPWSMLAK